jgi:predicted MPP superfamily phosphohydrolase
VSSDSAITRREFLRKAGWGAAGLVVAGGGAQAAYEKRWFEVTRPQIAIPDLPEAFEGLTIGHIADVHHGPFTPIERVSRMMDLATGLQPDLWALTGDMVHREAKYIGPVWEQLARLSAPLGVWCVMGNHDHWEGIEQSRAGAKAARITELHNRATVLERGGERLWLVGAGDKWSGEQLLDEAVAGLPSDAVALMLVHNPEAASDMRDARVKLMMAGHSHGGQVVLPLLGPISVPCDRRYTVGLVKTPVSQVYISRGLGLVTVPFRLNCRPEIPVYTLTRA